MTEVHAILSQQYAYVKSSRQALFDYCRTFHPDAFIKESASFGRGGSIRNLLTHIINTYQYWICYQGLEQKTDFTPYEEVHTLDDIAVLFAEVDEAILKFLNKSSENLLLERTLLTNTGTVTATPLKLFTHVITHEYHHKGQILTLSRHLGYVPADTDVIR